MWSLLKTRRWIAFTLLVVFAITAFGLLSRWQWQRAEEERTARVAWATQAAERSQSLPDAVRDPREWLPVRVAGEFDASSTVLVRQRPLDGRNGFWVVTALDTELGRVWVNRGWVPVSGAATGSVDAPVPPSGPVVVEARLRLPGSSDTPEPADLPEGQVSSLVPARLGADIPDFYLEAVASAPTDPGVTRIPAPAIDETQNISYALQWMVFAAVALAGWWFFLRREAREDHAAATAPSEAA